MEEKILELEKVAKREEKIFGIRPKKLKTLAQKFIKAYQKNGFIELAPKEALNLPLSVFIPLIKKVYKQKRDDLLPSFRKYNDSSWVTKSSFIFLNVRACGRDEKGTGNFIDAIKLIPTLTENAIHLAPFFDHSLQILYAIDSLNTISEDVINSFYKQYGINSYDQVRYFVDIAHIFGKAVGFDLEPHTSQFSRIAIQYPQYFRWIKLSEDRKQLFGGVNQEEMLTKQWQEKIIREIISIRDSILKEYGLESIEPEEVVSEEKIKSIREAHGIIINELIKNGIWTIPSHTWKGAGIPEFSHYVFEKNYPEFTYISWEGENHREHAFGLLTPYKFYDGIPVNRIPSQKPTLDKNVLEFFADIFPKLHKMFGFDFIRFDYVDHIFDSVKDNDWDFPISDRMTPFVLKYTIEKAREKVGKWVGAISERMGTDIELYSQVGFDTVLGTDMLEKMNAENLGRALELVEKIEEINRKEDRRVSIMFAVDTHDTGHPLFNMLPAKKYGVDGMALRLFFSLFGSCGLGKRPSYKVIGNQDMTVGLYEANNRKLSLSWKNNKRMLRYYYELAKLYNKFKDFLENENTKLVAKGIISGKKGIWWKMVGDTKELTAIAILSDIHHKGIDFPEPTKNFKILDIIKEKKLRKISLKYNEKYIFYAPKYYFLLLVKEKGK